MLKQTDRNIHMHYDLQTFLQHPLRELEVDMAVSDSHSLQLVQPHSIRSMKCRNMSGHRSCCRHSWLTDAMDSVDFSAGLGEPKNLCKEFPGSKGKQHDQWQDNLHRYRQQPNNCDTVFNVHDKPPHSVATAIGWLTFPVSDPNQKDTKLL